MQSESSFHAGALWMYSVYVSISNIFLQSWLRHIRSILDPGSSAVLDSHCQCSWQAEPFPRALQSGSCSKNQTGEKKKERKKETLQWASRTASQRLIATQSLADPASHWVLEDWFFHWSNPLHPARLWGWGTAIPIWYPQITFHLMWSLSKLHECKAKTPTHLVLICKIRPPYSTNSLLGRDKPWWDKHALFSRGIVFWGKWFVIKFCAGFIPSTL